MRKIPSELDNPIDNLFINFGVFLAPYFKALSLTANDLTSISLITGLCSIYFFVQQQYVISAIFYVLSYIFDCFDGYYARKYGMVSQFGDYYDHVTDILIDGGLIILIVLKYIQLPNGDPLKYLPLLIVPFLLLAVMHLGCQEKYITQTDGDKVLATVKQYCPVDGKDDLRSALSITRYFGTGTYTLVFAVVILAAGFVDQRV